MAKAAAGKSHSGSKERRNPSIESLRALLIFADTKSISETARKLKLSQPVVTKKLQIFKDARACGAILIRSSGGKVSITDAARSALPAIQSVVHRYDRLLEFLSGAEATAQVIRFGCGNFAAEYYLPRAMATLRKEIVDFQIETRVCRGQDRILGTASGLYDLSVVTHDDTQIQYVLREGRFSDDALRVIPLVQHPICVVAAQGSEGEDLKNFPATRDLPVKYLSRWSLIGPDRQSGLRRQLEDKVASLSFLAEGGGWGAAKELARVGLGVAIIPLATVTVADREELICRRLSTEFAITDVVVHRKDDENPMLPHICRALLESTKHLREW
ncbi:MAG TPA: LysR family transcriptional regulator [Schlesneria sp.]|jgi:DNA-binding transcriptional LysR family regulator